MNNRNTIYSIIILILCFIQMPSTFAKKVLLTSKSISDLQSGKSVNTSADSSVRLFLPEDKYFAKQIFDTRKAMANQIRKYITTSNNTVLLINTELTNNSKKAGLEFKLIDITISFYVIREYRSNDPNYITPKVYKVEFNSQNLFFIEDLKDKKKKQEFKKLNKNFLKDRISMDVVILTF